jgi:sortase (surface protein transpeptidase)
VPGQETLAPTLIPTATTIALLRISTDTPTATTVPTQTNVAETAAVTATAALSDAKPPIQATAVPSRTKVSSAPPQPRPSPIGLDRGSGNRATRLVIPHLQMDIPVKEATWTSVEENGAIVSDWDVPFDAAGHLFNTAEPGENGNAIFSGHHNLVAPNKFGVGLFAGMWNLQIGDEIEITNEAGTTFVYQVSQSYPLKERGEPMVVREQHARQIFTDTGAPIATFITCWNGQAAPLSGNTYRWIVTAQLIGTKS